MISTKTSFTSLLLFLCILGLSLSKLPDSTLSPLTATDMHKMYRISGTVVSPDKLYVLFTARQWDQDTGKFYSNIQFAPSDGSGVPKALTTWSLDKSDSSPVFSSQYKNNILFIRTTQGRSHVYTMKFDPNAATQPEPTQLTNYPIDVSNLLFENNVLMFSAEMYYSCDTMQCTADLNAEVAKRGANTYQIYDQLMIRHWDVWYTQGSASHPFYQKIKLNEETQELELDGEAVDLLLKEELSSPPIEGGSDQFSISSNGNLLAFSVHTKNREMAWTTKWDIYLVDLSAENAITILTEKEEGRCQSPKFSSDGKKISYLCMLHKGLESENLYVRVYDIENKKQLTGFDQSSFKPQISDYAWYEDVDKNVFLLSVVDAGYSRIYKFDFNAEAEAYISITDDMNYYGTPIVLTSAHVIINHSSFTTPDVIALMTQDEIDAATWTVTDIVDLNFKEKEKFELLEAESFTFKGGNGDDVQGWIMKPVQFDETKTYPLAFLIHGGPEGAWEPSWSYRWNPQLWASHGYAVVMINPHGSSGMGIDFQNAVRNDWGGLPFQDLMNGWQYIKDTYKWVDMDRVGGCGASYGGYMVNWIQGNNDDKKFKCLVTHDGVFSTVTMFYATEEMWFPMSEYCPHDKWGCTPFESDESRVGFEKFSPESRVDHWNTPHLIIHGSQDFRIPVSEGISAFTALQLRGVPSRFLHFPDENHWVLKPENSIKWYAEVLGWLDKYLEYN